MCQLQWFTIWPVEKVFLGMSEKAFLNEIGIWIWRLCNTDFPSLREWALNCGMSEETIGLGKPCPAPSFQPQCKTWGILCHFLLSSSWDLNHGLFWPQAHLQRENKDCVPSEPLRWHESRPACTQSYPPFPSSLLFSLIALLRFLPLSLIQIALDSTQ